jgi:hypothetical protein
MLGYEEMPPGAQEAMPGLGVPMWEPLLVY